MKVLFFANLRDYTRCKEADIDHCATVLELLRSLGDRYGRKLTSKLMAGEEMSDEIIILVNGRNIINMDGINTILNPDDIISIFPVVAGG